MLKMKNACAVLVRKHLKGGEHLGDLLVGGRIICDAKMNVECESVGWIDVAQDRVQ
jgi:hypothetical protein